MTVDLRRSHPPAELPSSERCRKPTGGPDDSTDRLIQSVDFSQLPEELPSSCSLGADPTTNLDGGKTAMTCVVGATDGGAVILGADSAAGSGEEIYTIPAAPKIFARGPYLFGVCGSYRVAQVLRFRAELPDLPTSMDLEPFLVRELVPAIRNAVQAEDVAESGRRLLGEKTTLLLGCKGQLWHVGPDLTVLPEGRFAAIGSGRLRAYAALHALEAAGVEPPRRRLELALEAAAEFTSNVRPPWQFLAERPASVENHSQRSR